MKTKYLFVAIILVVAILSFGGVAKADNSALIAQLMAQIQALQAQLQTMLAQQGGQTWCHTFNTNLGFSNSGTEVQQLHNALSRNGLSLSNTEGTPGSNFDEDVAAAVVQFQAKYGIRQTGYVGPLTRGKLNALYGCGTTPTPTQPSITVTSPNGGETWKVGETHNITWNATGVQTVNITLNFGASAKYSIVSNVPATNGSYSWTIPNNFSFSNTPAWAIVSSDSVADYSNNSFIVSGPIPCEAQTCPSGQICGSAGICVPITQSTITLDQLKSMYVDYAYGGQLNNGQYLSSVIQCNASTCMNGNKLYLGLDTTTAKFGDFNNDGTQDAVVGVRYGYVSANDDITTAPLDAKTEFLALVQTVNGQPKIIDKLYGPTDIFGSWERINSIAVNNGQLTVDVIELVNYNDTTGQHEIRRIYQINIVNNKFQIISVSQYSVG